MVSRLRSHKVLSRQSQRSFGQNLKRWLRLIWLDVLVMICVLVIAYFFKDRVPIFRQSERIFAMWRDGPDEWHGETYISHPKQRLILSNLVAALIFAVVPIAIILFLQIFIRNFWDTHMAILGLLQGLVTMTLVQTTLKILFGAFRPYFLSICQPDLAKLEDLYSKLPDGFSGPVWAPVSVCLGEASAVRGAMQSFPSGHTGSASTVGVYLALYLHAKLKSFSDYHTSYWKLLVVIWPVLGAISVAGLLVIDGNHHLRDVVPSIFIGAIIGVLAYRGQYRSAFAYHNNHFPLPYHSFTPTSNNNDLLERLESRHSVAVRWPAY